jgi:transcriptional regulator with XRE-family HTH domain
MVEVRRMTDETFTLGPVLKEIRVRRHLSLTEMARASGLSRSAIVRIEAGDRNPGLVTLTGIAGALGIRFLVESDGVYIEDAP